MIPSAVASRLEKAAVDNGFDRELPRQVGWLGFASTQCPLHLWLSFVEERQYYVALSKRDVAESLMEFGIFVETELPNGATACIAVADIPALHRLVRRAFQLANTLPHELLHIFESRSTVLPSSTEIERMAIQRIGQDVFRSGLLEFWDGRCAISGLAIPDLLRASHIKPWASCDSDAERLDIYNGLLLSPHLDLLFDRGFITVGDDGRVVVSGLLSESDRRLLGVDRDLTVSGLQRGHLAYLPWHRELVYRQLKPQLSGL
jgi:putative restriction endonuclease